MKKAITRLLIFILSGVLLLLSTCKPIAPPSSDTDIGLRIFDGVETIRVACEPASDSTPLRIFADGVVYGILLVDPSDPSASKLRIQTSQGVKAIKRL